MKNKIAFILLMLPSLILAQENKNGIATLILEQENKSYIVKNGDTIHCDSIKHMRSSGNVRKITYYARGNEIVLTGKDECESVTSFFSNDSLFVLMPLLQNPKKYKRHYQLLTDGIVKVYSYHYVQRYKATSQIGSVERRREDPDGDGYAESHHSDYFAVLPSGETKKITQASIKKIFHPYFMQCEEFAQSEYKKLDKKALLRLDTLEEYFNAMTTYYNSVCK